MQKKEQLSGGESDGKTGASASGYDPERALTLPVVTELDKHASKEEEGKLARNALAQSAVQQAREETRNGDEKATLRLAKDKFLMEQG